MSELIRGKVHKFGDNINTDYINPAKYMELDIPTMIAHALEGADPDFTKNCRPGDIVVAGSNFGSGSSRETAPMVIKGNQVGAVIAKDYARIFYRNSINIGLTVLVCPDTDEINAGDELEVDPGAGTIFNLTTGKQYSCDPLPDHILELVNDGGLIPHLKKTMGK